MKLAPIHLLAFLITAFSLPVHAQNPKLTEGFKRADSNGDGKLAADEVNQFPQLKTKLQGADFRSVEHTIQSWVKANGCKPEPKVEPLPVKAGSRSDQLICLTDLMATCAEIVGAKLPDNAGEDSVSILPALLGTADKPLQEAVVHHSISGGFAIRQGQWKLELCKGSAGWSKGDDGEPTQLYDMSKDVGERTNEYKSHPEIVARLTKLLEKYIADGRSTPGTPHKNDAAIIIRKKAAPIDETAN